MMADLKPPALVFHPTRLLNSASPWATTVEDLQLLYSCSATGAITTRTSLLKGFPHDDSKHQYVFFKIGDQSKISKADPCIHNETASLNTLGYSPFPLFQYLEFIKTIAAQNQDTNKQIIVSVTGNPEEVAECYELVAAAQRGIELALAVEVNLSCPNIPGAPPPAYSGAALTRYLSVITAVVASRQNLPRLPFGFKLPPYTHMDEFSALVDALLASAALHPAGVTPLSFLTATNTLGSCLVLDPSGPAPSPALPGEGIGGMAGAPLHALALGKIFREAMALLEETVVADRGGSSVATLRGFLDANPEKLGHVLIIGVGGVSDASGYRRMRSVGADAVGVATALGLMGTAVFKEIWQRES